MRPDERLRALAVFLAQSPESLDPHAFTPAGADIDSVIDVRAVFQQPPRPQATRCRRSCCRARALRADRLREGLLRRTQSATDIFDLRGIDRDAGRMVVVRPDQYVANVLPLDAHEDLLRFFEGVLLPQSH